MGQRFGNAVRFEGWDGGEFGIMDPALAARRDKQMFTGRNVMRYRSGLLGPRPGVKKIELTSPPTGVMRAMDSWIGSGGNTHFWAWIGSNVYDFNATTGVVSSAYSGSLPTPSKPVSRGGSYGLGTILNVGSNLYNLNHTSSAISTITSSAGDGGPIGSYMTRLVASGGTSGNRMYFSNPGPAYTTWPATSYVEIGPALPHTFYTPFRDGLLVGIAGTTWAAVTGVLGATTTVRILSTGGCPATPTRGVSVDDDRVWYFGRATDAPASFNGAVHEKWTHLRNWSGGTPPFNDSGSTPSFACVAMPWLGTNDWFALTRYGARGLMYANGVFTFHDIEVAVDPFFAPYQEFLIVGKGSTGNYYYFAPGVYDRPAFTSDTYANVGDDSSTPFTECWFETPEWWAEEGHQVRVQKVIVDYVGWNTGSSANNRIDVQVTSLRPWDTSGVSSSATKTLLDSPGSSFSTSGTTGRAEGLFGDQGFGGGFKVRLSNLRGVAIRAVSVLLAEEARRP